mgnify:CR=1 FL=1
MLTLALLGLLSTQAAADIANPGFEQGADGWMIETGRAGSDAGGPNRVEFLTDGAFEGRGWRYITFQVFEVDREHAHVLAHGGREARAPVTPGPTARISLVRDPDGNWIELSQRASLPGSLEPASV